MAQIELDIAPAPSGEPFGLGILYPNYTKFNRICQQFILVYCF